MIIGRKKRTENMAYCCGKELGGGMKSFLLQVAPLKEELFCRYILRETEISHFAGGAYCSVMTDGSFDESKITLHFLNVSSDF